MGQIIPIDMIWKILMSNKNNYIYDLEERIDNFVDLFHKINLSKNQIAKIRVSHKFDFIFQIIAKFNYFSDYVRQLIVQLITI